MSLSQPWKYANNDTHCLPRKTGSRRAVKIPELLTLGEVARDADLKNRWHLPDSGGILKKPPPSERPIYDQTLSRDSEWASVPRNPINQS